MTAEEEQRLALIAGLMAQYPVEKRRSTARGPVWKVARKREGDKK